MHSNTRSFQRARFEVWIVWKFGFELYFSKKGKSYQTQDEIMQLFGNYSRAKILRIEYNL